MKYNNKLIIDEYLLREFERNNLGIYEIHEVKLNGLDDDECKDFVEKFKNTMEMSQYFVCNSNVSKDNLTIEEVLENYDNDKKMKSIVNSVAELCFEGNCSAILANLKVAMESFNENYSGSKIDDDTLSRIIIKAEVHNILPNNNLLNDDVEFGKELAHFVETQPLDTKNFTIKDFIDDIVEKQKNAQEQTISVRTRR